MAEIIEEGRKACRARDKAQTELTALKKQVEESKQAFEQEWKELGLLIKEDKQKQEDERKERLALATSKQVSMSGAMGANTPASEQRSECMLETQDCTNGITGKNETMNSAEKQEHDFDEALAKIKEATGIADVNEIITRFLEVEEKNFSRFNYVMELNAEIESLEQQVSSARIEVEEVKGRGASIDTQRKKELKKMFEKKEKTEAKVKESEARYEEASSTLEKLKTDIAKIYRRIDCSNINELLGSQGVTDSNVLKHLAVIEQRALEIMEQYAAAQENGENLKTAKTALPTDNAKRKETPAQLNIDPPAADDFSSGDESGQDDDERPLTREELQQKTWKTIQSK